MEFCPLASRWDTPAAAKKLTRGIVLNVESRLVVCCASAIPVFVLMHIRNLVATIVYITDYL
ncbi:MAG: hypothetical protein II951_03545 [Bacteroidales bacterium]|nr:hypothetical protein [Bacteroidales bacterium]